MQKLLFALLFCASIIILSIIYPPSANAELIFEDDFESYENGEFPSKWVEMFPSPTCDVEWQVINGEAYSKITNKNSCTGNIMPNNEEWPILLTDYEFEADVRFGVGVDHNLAYRILPLSSGSLYELHFHIPGGFSTGHPPNKVLFDSPGIYFTGINYHIRTRIEGRNVKVYIDNVLVREFEVLSDMAPGKIALRIGTGSNPNSETWFDNVRVTTLDHVDSINLPVSPLKQTSTPWNDDIYDSAFNWSSDDSFSSWGCAVTSAAMVFNYHGLTEIADDSELDPGSLNEWLKSQSDGYVRNGLTNWLALTRLSRQISEQNGVDFDAFEFTKIFTSDHQEVKNSIDNGDPDILREPGHFVVAKGYSDTSILINDPYYDRDELFEFENISRFTPSSTDLSYIMLVVDTNIDVKVFDENNLEVETVVVIDDPITDPSGSSETSAQSLKTVYIKKPDSGIYRVEINSDSDYFLDVYLYDKNGNPMQSSIEDDPELGTNNYILIFDKDDSSGSEITEEVTLNSLINDINYFRASGDISNFGVYISLLSKANVAKGFYGNNITKKVANSILNAMLNELKAQRGKKISEGAYIILSTDIEKLIEQF